MSYNKEKFAKLIDNMMSSCNSGYGMSPATMKSYLPMLTETLKCQKDKYWRKLCFDIDNSNAQSYLKLTPKELIKYNGMSLKNWKEEDISRKDVLVALDSAWHILTPAAVRTTKKIRKHLTNKDILTIALEDPYYVHDYRHTCHTIPNPAWLNCLDTKDHSLLNLKSFDEWRNFLGIVFWFVSRDEYPNSGKRIDLLKKLNAPKTVIQYALDLSNFTARYNLVNPARDYTRKMPVALSTCQEENEEFEVYLKMKGINWNKEWSNHLSHEQHYEDNLFALNECLIAKYDKQEKENVA